MKPVTEMQCGERKRMVKPFGRFTWESWVTGVNGNFQADAAAEVSVIWRLKVSGGRVYSLAVSGRNWRALGAAGLRELRKIQRGGVCPSAGWIVEFERDLAGASLFLRPLA